ncbi:MAG: amidohydrolase [Roseburia sp.]
MDSYLLLKQGTIHNAMTEEPFIADILVENGKIKKIAPVLEGKVINEAKVIDATGIDIYPGFVDAHCHLGLDGYAVGFAGADYNEPGDPVTPQLSAVDAVNPQDETFRMAREGGVTCVSTGPGSSNVIGGTFCVIKTSGRRVDDMLVKGRSAMKIAFGENPKNCHKEKGVYSRMSVAAKLRETLQMAQLYAKKCQEAGCPEGIGRADLAELNGEALKQLPVYDAKMEAMLPVIRGEIPLKAHVHRADDIYTAIRIAREFQLDLRIDHVTDGALIAEDLAKEGFPVAVGPSFGHAGKYELKNKGFHTPGILAKAGCQVSIITDSPVIEQRYLALCAARAIYNGMKEFDALQAITIHPAKHIGASDRVGSIEEGKDADFVLIKGTPFLIDARILYTIIDGNIVYQSEDDVLGQRY